jgi:hypothetical protein
MGNIFALSLKDDFDFYNDEPTIELGMPSVSVSGEIANPGDVDFSKLPVHSVIVRETKMNEKGETVFMGAYRYDGYSLLIYSVC